MYNVLKVIMADSGLPALPAPQPPPVMPPALPVQLPVPPIQLVVPPAQPIQPDCHIYTGQKHIFLGQMTGQTHACPEGVKVQCFCLTLVGEATMWHESLRPINIYWNRSQNQFSQKYCQIGNTREQLFHA